jgi:hypothetical protein
MTNRRHPCLPENVIVCPPDAFPLIARDTFSRRFEAAAILGKKTLTDQQRRETVVSQFEILPKQSWERPLSDRSCLLSAQRQTSAHGPRHNCS